MAYKKITELPEATSAVDSDLLVIETQGGTKKIKKENLVFDTTVDPVPTEGSDNAVSSGGVYDALLEKENKLIFDNEPTAGSFNPVTSDGIYSSVSAKQDKLTFDELPSQGSSNPVKSNGIYASISEKQDKLTFDNVPTEGSLNPVTSGGLYSILAEKQDAPTNFTGILRAGETQITFTNDVFANDVIITNIFTDNENAMVTNAEQNTENKTVTLTISAMDVDVTVMISIAVADSPTPPTDMQSNINLSALGSVLDQTGTSYIFESDVPPEPGQDVYIVSD